MNNQNLLKNILAASEQYCGASFVAKILELKQERERYLNNIWKKEDYQSLVPERDIKNATRKIDFDTITYFAAKKLPDTKYTEFILDLITIAFDHGELIYSRELIDILFKAYEQYLSETNKASLYRTLGEIYFYQNDFEQSQHYFDKSLAQYESLADFAGIAKIKNSIGILTVEQGFYNKGKKLFEEAREIAKKHLLNDLIINCDINLGNYYFVIGDTQKALKKYFVVKEYAETHNLKTLTGKVNINIASTYKLKKEYQKALNFLIKAARIIEESENKFLKALYYLVKGEVLIYNEQQQSSMALLTSAFTLFSEIGDKLSIADTYRALGILFRMKGNEKVAVSYLENSIKINKINNNQLNLGETYIALGNLYFDKQKKTQAREYFSRAKDCFSLCDSTLRVIEVDKLIDKL